MRGLPLAIIPRLSRIPAVSAVVCNYNGESYLEECLSAVLAQEGLAETIVVDDGSSDKSVALVRERFPTVEVLELGQNRGPCAARNAGMRAARQRWVLAVDNDAMLDPGVLAKLRAALEARPDCSIAQVRSVLHDEPSRIHYDGGDFHYAGAIALKNFYTPLAEARDSGIVDANALIGITALLDRDVVLAAGGYDEELFYLSEDYELALRLRIQGVKLLSVEDALVRHRGGTVGLSFRGGAYPRRRVFLHSRNRCWILAKNYSARTLLVAMPGILLHELAWLLFALKQRELGRYLAGKLAFLRSSKRVLRARRTVQTLRKVPDRELLVGGPLTLSPSLLATAPARFAARTLDLLLRTWWTLVRPLAG